MAGDEDAWEELKRDLSRWDRLKGDPGFWAIVAVLVLVADLMYGQIQGSSGTQGNVVVGIAIVCLIAIAGLGVWAWRRGRQPSEAE